MPQRKPIIVGMDVSTGPDKTAFAIRRGMTVIMSAGNGTPTMIQPGWLQALNASRKADREQLALAFSTIALAQGAIVSQRDKPRVLGYGGAGIDLEVRANGVGALIGISDLHGGSYAIISWFNDYSDGHRGARNFTPAFNRAVGASSGGSHHKATSCGSDWYSLAMQLDAGLRLAARGEAFEPYVT